MKIGDILLWVLGVVSLGYAVWRFILFATARDASGLPDMWAGTNHLWIAIASTVVGGICIVWAFVRRPHEVEEIHVTK
jgi:hypothetical protein